MKIIMYHYVKDFKKYTFAKLKGLDVREFEAQIKFLKSKFIILDPQDIHEIASKKKNFEENYCWLTFDDGYLDHYDFVIPILEKNKIKGSFFPPVISTLQRKILNVNKIQLILGKEENTQLILNEIKKNYLTLNNNKKESDFEKICEKINTRSRHDNKETIIIKRLLQREFDINTRDKICNNLFKKNFLEKENEIAKNYYMSTSHLKEIFKLGHEIGLHGYNHDWYSYLNEKNQEKEINDTLCFWRENQLIREKFTCCYPYGDYNANTIKVLKSLNCSLGLTTKVDSVNKKNYNTLELPRFDTNDFPKN